MIRNNNVINLSQEVYNEYLTNPNIDALCFMFNLEKYEIIGLLNYQGVEEEIKDDLSMVDFDDDKVILISDTHVGSYGEKFRYLDTVYDYAAKYGINKIIHGGDTIHSTKKNVKKNCWNPEEQALILTSRYPYDSSISNYILFGNHDYDAMLKNDKVYRIIDLRQDFNILGFKKAYFKFAKQFFSINHKCDKYPLSIPTIGTLVNFYGHRHECRVLYDSLVYIPALSEEIIDYGNGFEPGFLTLEKDSDNISIYKHVIGQSGKEILTKRYK